MDTPTLRIGIVGAGSIVRQRHLPNLKVINGVKITAICNSTYESSRRACEELAPGAVPIKDWTDLLKLPELDVVWIGTYPHLHAPITIAALDSGRHVFCQARMAMNLTQALEMQRAAAQNPHLVTMLCPPPHGMKGDRVVLQILQSGQLGRVVHVRLRSLGGQYLDPNAPPHWRQREELSGNNVLTLGIYVEVLQRWLGSIQNVFAEAQIVHRLRKGYEVRIPDLLTVICQFSSGATGVLEFSGVAAHAPQDSVEVYGTEATLRYDFATDELFFGLRSEPTMSRVEITPQQEGLWRVEEDFVAAVRSGGALRPRPSFDDGVAYMRVVDAVAESWRTGRRTSCL